MNVAKNMLKDYENVSTDDFDVLPCNTGVLLQPYNDNPYKKIEKIHFDNAFYRHDIGAKALAATEEK